MRVLKHNWNPKSAKHQEVLSSCRLTQLESCCMFRRLKKRIYFHSLKVQGFLWGLFYRNFPGSFRWAVSVWYVVWYATGSHVFLLMVHPHREWWSNLTFLCFRCSMQDKLLPSLKLTFSPLKMDGWNTTFLLGRLIFRGYVSFREGIHTVLSFNIVSHSCRPHLDKGLGLGIILPTSQETYVLLDWSDLQTYPPWN